MAEESAPDKIYGMSEDELLAYQSVYREDLLKDKVVLVSGGGTGIGQAIAVVLAKLGARVVICSRKEENLQQTAVLLEQIGVPCDIHTMTIREPDQVTELMAKIWQRHGRLDIQVNNAGGQFPQDAIDFEAKGWKAVIDTNLSGTFYMMQAAARQWRDHDQPGSVVNIVANFWRGMPQIAHTGAARAAVSNLALTLGVEWAPFNIRVNCVAPGTIETTGLNVYPKEAQRFYSVRNPMKRLGTVMDVAEAVVYVGGPSGAHITGETLTVDGGQFMWGQRWSYGEPEYFRMDNL